MSQSVLETPKSAPKWSPSFALNLHAGWRSPREPALPKSAKITPKCCSLLSLNPFFLGGGVHVSQSELSLLPWLVWAGIWGEQRSVLLEFGYQERNFCWNSGTRKGFSRRENGGKCHQELAESLGSTPRHRVGFWGCPCRERGRDRELCLGYSVVPEEL